MASPKPSRRVPHDAAMSRTPSYIQLAPRRAMASFENLVALANHQERLREARKIVWRERGEPAVELKDLWECMEHAGRGGLRAAAIAFALRASVNLVLATIRIGKVPKNTRLSLIQRAIFGKDSFRFAAMLGSFVTIYKATLNALPILLPVNEHSSLPSPFEDEEEDVEAPPTPSEVPLSARQPRLSLSAQAHQVWVRKKTRRWHSMFAGALAGGLAVMFEKRSRRVVIAQQLFVRGLQGSYNAFTSKHGFHLPNGEVLMFCLCCTQIVYALFARPDTLPRSYTAWLTAASGGPPSAIKMVQDMNRTGTFEVKDLDKILSREDIIPTNQATLIARRALATNSPPDFGSYTPCSAVHPWVESCTHVTLPRFFTVFKWAFPIYGALHFVPMILFKWNAFFKNPLHKLGRAGWATIRSSAFLATFIATFQSWVCFKHYLHGVLSSQTRVKLPQKYVDFLLSKYSYGFGGLFGALSLFVEEKRRRGELAMYVLPKGMESAWLTARGKGWVFHTGQFGEMILTAIGMSMVMSIYQNDPQHLSGLVRRILYQFIGPN
ncbi:hypothetical protein CY34DRAFT_803768 [Suillus luteus UH-Slu-Lm8-n1]|uniref:Unplaced genomic scaffold CY34scaffold_80, whole genome shotgun sequence n=1 Tax=Suillus luteus UH-Slu-Lm8-n1 TaxID=930992 RepID=A0A0D0BB87_9AGAM|nr:hypothetical protein CY34DRAFT_803768 [Suillus luteus UH-Slu-Lm8-n1]